MEDTDHPRRAGGLLLTMELPLSPPLLPMLAKRVAELPDNGAWFFEPKWDGFRVLIFRDHAKLLLQSRDGKPLNRYFPELLPVLREQLPQRCVLDGEIVINRDGRLDFDTLQLRVHPSASRVNKLAVETPASIVLFDLLALGEHDWTTVSFADRRSQLEKLLGACTAPLHLTPATQDITIARDWFQRFEGAGLDGVMCKATESLYEQDKRSMLKVKHERDCDCVVAGFRWHKGGEGVAVGSLLLGLYDDAGELQHVGTCASFSMAARRELTERLTPYRVSAGDDHPWGADGHSRMPGVQSRWSAGKDLSWETLRPELVVEVAYEHMQGPRFRHMAQFRRWRVDKRPRSCTYAQLEEIAPEELARIFSTK